MSDYIEQMARCVWEQTVEFAYGGEPWERIRDKEKEQYRQGIKRGIQSLWIDIEEHGLPEESRNIWFCEEDGTIHRGCYEGDRAWWDEDELELIAANVTHWMPMAPPPPPKRYETHPTA